MALCAISILSLTADAQSTCGGTTVADYSPELAPKARQFLAGLSAAVKAGDKQKVAAMIENPLRVNSDDGKHRMIRGSAAFIKEYDSVFTAAVKKAIADQKPECLFANDQGVMIGGGDVWFEEQQNGTLKIKSINLSKP